MAIRQARDDDGPTLQLIDVATWSEDVTPAPTPQVDDEFFSGDTRPEDVLVAEAGDEAVGYVLVAPRYRGLTAGEHVQELKALAVLPPSQGQGIGFQLVTAAVDTARTRGGRRLTLRVLGSNEVARRLYERCGFVVEGVAPAEFLLGGRYVDDVLLGLDLISV